MEVGERPKEEAMFTWQCDCSHGRVKGLLGGSKMDTCVLFIHNSYQHKTPPKRKAAFKSRNDCSTAVKIETKIHMF